MVLDILAKDENQAIGHRYRLKDSIMQMGPAGFQFENYVSKILGEYGFHIKSKRSKVNGTCVVHEIDIIAATDATNARYMIECKFHNFSGIYTGLKESLYTHARFLDLKGQFDNEMLVCNTKISNDAITYGRCIGQEILSWRYPKNKGLETLIETKILYPVTILGLSKRELQILVQNDFMLVKDLLNLDSNQLCKRLNIPIHRIEFLQKIARQITR
jgi:predicted RecB family endonuclease